MAERRKPWEEAKGNAHTPASPLKTLRTQDQSRKNALCGQLIAKKQRRGRSWITDVGLFGGQQRVEARECYLVAASPHSKMHQKWGNLSQHGDFARCAWLQHEGQVKKQKDKLESYCQCNKDHNFDILNQVIFILGAMDWTMCHPPKTL